MKKITLALVSMLMVFAPSTLFASARKDKTPVYNANVAYEVATIQVATEGTKLIKVSGEGKREEDAVEAARLNAISACIFKGLPAGQNANATPALCTDPRAAAENAGYFNEFFKPGGEYMKYLNLSTSKLLPNDRIKMKKKYKVSIYIQVMHDNLRKKLEADGIIKSLNHGF